MTVNTTISIITPSTTAFIIAAIIIITRSMTLSITLLNILTLSNDDSKHKDKQHNDIQHYATQHKNNQHDDIQHTSKPTNSA
jgi:hypothetical protein